MSPQLYEYYNTGDNYDRTGYSNIWWAQTFTVGGVGHTVTSVKIKAWRVGSPGTLTLGIRATDAGGHPTGPDLTSGTIDANTFTTSSPGAWYEIPVTEYQLSPNTKYAIVVRCPAGDANNCIKWRAVYVGTYDGGNTERSSDSGSSWTAQTDFDQMFEVWGNPVGVAHYQTISEILGMVDSVAAPATLHKVVADQLGLKDTVAAPGTLHLTVAEKLGMVDTLTFPKYVTIMESLGMVDSVAERRDLKQSVQESLGLVDTVAKIKSLRQTITEQLGLLDSAVPRSLMRRPTDGLDHTTIGGVPRDPDLPDNVEAIYVSVKNTWQDAENLDDVHGYRTYIWIPEETFQVRIMKLHVFAEKFRAHSKAALSKDLGTKTSVAGGGHSHPVTGATSSYVTPSHTHTVNIGGQTSTGSGHHRHMMFDFISTTPGGYAARKFKMRNAAGETMNLDLTPEFNADMYTEEEVLDHTHEVDFGVKTSASGGASHAHTVSGQTAEAVTDHQHDVPIGSHDHAIDFGIYEEAIPGRTLSAKLYDPDGNLVKDFGVITTGEADVILDLSGYFEELKYGMYYLDLAASARLRARCIFYELCLMYAY